MAIASVWDNGLKEAFELYAKNHEGVILKTQKKLFYAANIFTPTPISFCLRLQHVHQACCETLQIQRHQSL